MRGVRDELLNEVLCYIHFPPRLVVALTASIPQPPKQNHNESPGLHSLKSYTIIGDPKECSFPTRSNTPLSTLYRAVFSGGTVWAYNELTALRKGTLVAIFGSLVPSRYRGKRSVADFLILYRYLVMTMMMSR